MKASSNSIILMGGGGHAKVLIDLIRTDGEYQIAGILDPKLNVGDSVKGVPVLGGDHELDRFETEGVQNVAIAVGSVKTNSLRKKLFDQCLAADWNMPALVHQRAVIASDVTLSAGVQIMAGAIIQTDTTLGAGTVVNTGAQVDHDCEIGAHVFLAPGVILSGGVTIGDGAFIGAGAVVIQGVKIGNNAVVAAGAVVVRDVEDEALVKGVPAK